jgi:hypothetical protein
MRTLGPFLKRLTKISRFASDVETHWHLCKTEPEATMLQEMLRVRALMNRTKLSGGRFPVQNRDVPVQSQASRIPVRNTNRTPLSAARSDTRAGRDVRCFDASALAVSVRSVSTTRPQ